MEKENLERLVGILLLAVSVLIIGLLVGLQFQTFTEAAAELSFITVGAIATVGVKFLVFAKKSTLEKSPMFNWTDYQLIQSAIGREVVSSLPDLSYLDIRYSRLKDTADNHHRPYFVINTKTKKAFWVQTELLVLNKRNIIHSNTHESEAELRKYLKNQDITLVEGNPKIGELS